MSEHSIDVRSDADIEPEERETGIHWTQEDDRASVFSEEPALVRRLLRNPAFEVEKVRIQDGDIVAVQGRLPLGGVRLKAKPAKTNRHSKVHSSSGLDDEAVDDDLAEIVAAQGQEDGWIDVFEEGMEVLT